MRVEMPEKRMKYDREFCEEAVRIVGETGRADCSGRAGPGRERGHAGELGEPCPGGT